MMRSQVLAVVEKSCARKPLRPSLQAEVREAEESPQRAPEVRGQGAGGGGHGARACSSSWKRQVGA